MTTRDCMMSGPAMCQLLPMHLWLEDDGRILSVGPTLAKLLPDLHRGLAGQLASERSGQAPDVVTAIRDAVDRRSRLFLRVEHAADLVLRGHGIRLTDGSLLLSLGFGIGLHRAIRMAGLTDDDFAPSDLAMELLFLHEANCGVLAELSRFTEQLAKSREVAMRQALTDPLTGLDNRRKLEAALAAALRTPVPGTRTPFAVVHLDLDNFKQVNDRLGHQAGDDLLRAVATVLREEVRRTDTAARVGGDEFVLLLVGMTCPAALRDLSQRIIARVRTLTPPGLGELCVSASLGVVVWSEGAPDCADEVLAAADEALYASKRGGRNRATIREETL
jgi:diguanylate cyclase (GGDEF)-like protein